jgi:hypothetical protein
LKVGEVETEEEGEEKETEQHALYIFLTWPRDVNHVSSYQGLNLYKNKF